MIKSMVTPMVTVHLSRLNITPRKTRLVARLLKGRPVTEAEHQLLVLGKRAAGPLLKLLRSALAAAKQRDLQPERLIIQSITVGDGSKRRKFHAGSRGRAMPIISRTSNVVLTISQPMTAAKVKVSP